ncbi:hypothetical protein F511_09930 [Dorcoceras hygrometricum]|uniref:Uncharacterized protein n=1 Tax=Dorcoceras hygrometricum TaxID=472368 RepID=A0A2Z7CAA1_9LAMI|nr:hypothetical protein F511_09930 [Dorcoceras hygrometricum]
MQQMLDKFEGLRYEACGNEVIYEEDSEEGDKLQMDELIMTSSRMEDGAHEVQDPLEEIDWGVQII